MKKEIEKEMSNRYLNWTSVKYHFFNRQMLTISMLG